MIIVFVIIYELKFTKFLKNRQTAGKTIYIVSYNWDNVVIVKSK